MGMFGKLINPSSDARQSNTTKHFDFGSPEAEAETTESSAIQLGQVFGDFLNVFPKLKSGRFIITGRKGAGKTAIAEYIAHKFSTDPVSFCEFVREVDLDVERAIQTGDKSVEASRSNLLFEWIILVRLSKLLCENESLNDLREVDQLSKFLNKNSGYVDLNAYEISELCE